MATNIQTFTRKLRQYANTNSYIVAMYIFGSHAAGKATPASDLDVAILLQEPVQDSIHLTLRLDAEISHMLEPVKVDVIVLNTASLPLRAEVVRTGKLIFTRDVDTRLDFEVRTMTEWWDYKPLLDELDRILFRQIKERFTDDQRRAYQRAREAFARTH